jgi:hypothetical protein
MNSFNYYALGSVGEWLYRFLRGINQKRGTADRFMSRVELPPAITADVRVPCGHPRPGSARPLVTHPHSPVGFPVAQDAEEAAFRVALGVRELSGAALPGAETVRWKRTSSLSGPYR